MLLEFRMKNFKSFKEEIIFKMQSAPIKDLEYSLIIKTIKGKEIKALPTSVIYGPNASGKTNLIGGMEVLRAIVLKGSIFNNENFSCPNFAVDKLELIPNVDSDKNKSIEFGIKFIVNELLIDYSLAINIGEFLDLNYDRKITSEILYINEKMIYERRDNNVQFGKDNEIKEFLIENFSKSVLENISVNLDSKELFLNGIFKTLYSKKLYDIIINWFKDKFMIIYHADKMSISPIIDDYDKNKKYYINKNLNNILKEFGLSSEKIGYPLNKDEEHTIPLSFIKTNNKQVVLPSEFYESFGTLRFLNIFPIILSVLNDGATLVMDELDASIHPMAIMSIIKIFHNNEINIKGAQLIFNTHNPIFLNNTLFRRDEIKFVEKEDKRSTLYSLSDFKTNGKNGVRNSEDYMKNYFINKYGAIKNIDFSEYLKNMEDGK